jgi:hypothetical protein
MCLSLVVLIDSTDYPLDISRTLHKQPVVLVKGGLYVLSIRRLLDTGHRSVTGTPRLRYGYPMNFLDW